MGESEFSQKAKVENQLWIELLKLKILSTLPFTRACGSTTSNK